MIEGAVFDADGTLLDSMMIWEKAGERYLRKRNIIPKDGLAEILFPMTLEESSTYLKQQYGLFETTEKVRAGILLTIEEFYRFEVQAKPGVKNFLQNLRKHHIPMVIATTGDRELLKTALKRLSLEPYFLEILTCTEFHTSKKYPYIYEKASDRLGTNPEQTFVFEDVLHAVASAAKGGFVTVAVEDAASHADAEKIRETADYYMTDFLDFNHFWEFASKKHL